MKYLIFGAKIFLDAYRDTFRVIKHFKMILINGFIIVPKLYYIRLFYSFSSFRNLIKVKLKSNFVFDDYFEDANISSSNLSKTIDEHGHTKTYKLKDELKKEFIKPEIFLVSENYLGIPMYVSIKNNFLSFEHTHPPHEYILSENKFIKVSNLKKEINEIIC